MPTHMRSRFSTRELTVWEPAEPFSFTKGLRVMRMPARTGRMNPWQHGTLLFDLATDPAQEHPLADDDVELRMLRLLARLMHDNDAPRGQFERLGIPFDTEPGPEHLLVRAQAARTAATDTSASQVDWKSAAETRLHSPNVFHCPRTST